MSVKIVRDNTADLVRDIEHLTSLEVVVGVTGTTNPRSDGQFGNASIAYIAEFGSPIANIPMRPIFGPGLANVQKSIINLLRSAGVAAAEGKKIEMHAALEACGLMAQQSIQQVITDGNFTPLAIGTIRARASSSKSGAVGAKEFLAIMKGHLGEKEWITIKAQAAEANKSIINYLAPPLLFTGAFRQSITYLVRKKQREAI